VVTRSPPNRLRPRPAVTLDLGRVELGTRRQKAAQRHVSELVWQRERLAYESDGSVYTMDDRGAHSRLIGPGVMPSWSPNGKLIALLRDNVLVVVDLRTHHSRTLDDLSCEMRGEDDVTDLQPPEWSPGSTKLVISRICDYGPSTLYDAWVIDARREVGRT